MAADPIESIATVKDTTNNYDQLWMVVSRANGRFVEFMERKEVLSDDANGEVVAIRKNQIRLDSCVTYSASATIFSGLSHLNGETVGILADGKVLDQQVVSSLSLIHI